MMRVYIYDLYASGDQHIHGELLLAGAFVIKFCTVTRLSVGLPFKGLREGDVHDLHDMHAHTQTTMILRSLIAVTCGNR